MKLIFLSLSAVLVCAASDVSTAQEAAPPPSAEMTVDIHENGPAKFPTFGSKDYFNLVFKTPIPSVQLGAPIRLREYIVNDKLELSLRSYIELVVANNTDIQLQKLFIEPQQNAITRAFSPFDPAVSGQFNAQRAVTPTTNILEGAQVLSQLTQPANASYFQRFMTGTELTANYRFNRLSTNNVNANVNPNYNSSIDVRFFQPLLRNRGIYVNKLPILVAKSRVKTAELTFENQLMQLITTAENVYWDVIGARENLRVQEQALALADASLKRAQRELELGAISALEIYQPQAQYAQAEIAVTQAKYRLEQAEDALRRQISVDIDPDLRTMPIELTASVDTIDNQQFEKEELVAQALGRRPDLLAAKNNIEIDDLTLKVAANNLKPDFGLTGVYTTQGIGGVTRAGGVVIPNGAGGFGDAWSQMWGFGYPVYGLGLQFRFPIRDRQAIANYADANVQKRMDTLQVRRIEQQTRLDVLNAISQVENSRASVELARIAADFAEKRVEGDQKRYDLGTITLFFLLASQADLQRARSELVNNSVQYRRNVLNLLQRTGSLLDERGIVIK